VIANNPPDGADNHYGMAINPISRRGEHQVRDWGWGDMCVYVCIEGGGVRVHAQKAECVDVFNAHYHMTLASFVTCCNSLKV